MAIPAQGKYLQETFGGDFVLKTFANSNTDNTYMFKSGDVVLLVDEKTMTLQLGGSSHGNYNTGKVESEEKQIPYRKPSRNVGEINKSKRDALQDALGSGPDLYDAFVNKFGEDCITRDDR